MKVKMILPALTEAKSPFFSPHQVFPVPSAGVGDTGRLPGPGRRDRHSG